MQVKDRLLNALQDAVSNFNNGSSPNDAIVKSAKSANFTIDQTSRLIEMFNTARTLHHFKHAEDKRNSFELVDPSVVLASLFEPETKKADHYYDYSEYDKPEQSYIVYDSINIKQAESKTTGLSLDELANFAMLNINSIKHASDVAYSEANVAASAAGSLFNKAASMLAPKDNDYNGDRLARLYAGYYKNEDWQPTLKKLAGFIPDYHKPTRDVANQYNGKAIIDDRDLMPILDVLKQAKDYTKISEDLYSDYTTLKKYADDSMLEYEQALGLTSGAKESWLSDIFTDSIKEAQLVVARPRRRVIDLDEDDFEVSDPPYVDMPESKPSSERPKSKSEQGDNSKANQGKQGKDKDKDKDKDKAKYPDRRVRGIPRRDTSKPWSTDDTYQRDILLDTAQNLFLGHVGGSRASLYDSVGDTLSSAFRNEASNIIDTVFLDTKLRERQQLAERMLNVQRGIMLQDLIATDPIISEADPTEVTRAYESMLQVSPDSSINKEVVRSWLRQAIHAQGVSPYDAKSLADLDKTMRQAR